MRDEPFDVPVGDIFAEIESKMRQLQGDHRIQFLGGDPVEKLDILIRDRRGRRLLTDAFAEQGRVGLQSLLVERSQDRNGLLEALAGHKAGRAETHAVATNGFGYEPVMGCRQDELAEERVQSAAYTFEPAGTARSILPNRRHV